MHSSRLLTLVVTGLLIGCGPGAPRPTPAPPSSIQFEDVAGTAGIRFSLGYGGRTPLTVLETAPGGAAFLDYDADGNLDVLLVGLGRVGLFRNRGGGRFADVTAHSGLDNRGEWMGCAVADYDGDCRVDVLLTGYRRTALFRNRGARFQDVTVAAGLNVPGWSLSAAFDDYDRDGRLDVYVTRYLCFDAGSPQVCSLGAIRTACGPEVYEPQRGMLFRNQGGGRFADVTAVAGLSNAHGKAWTALFSDLNGDRYPELYIANDMMPCDLYINDRGRFVEAGAAGSVAFDANGHLLGAMGADSADYDGDGDFDLLVTTFFAQPTCLYRNDGQGLFAEIGTRTGVGGPTIPYVGFGTGLVDLDNDGWLDLFVANGHVRDNVRSHDAGQNYAQPMQVFANRNGRFTEVSSAAGSAFHQTVVGRGAAFGDYDADGRLDILVCNLNGDARLLRNRSTPGNHWLRVRLKGAGSNSQGLGARVTAHSGGRSQVREVRTCGSVMSASEPTAHFGLGANARAERVTVQWPTGRQTVVHDLPGDQVVEIAEPGG